MHPDDNSYSAADTWPHTDRRSAECSRGTCVYHTQNMEVFRDFKEALHEISKTLQSLDKDMAAQTGGNKVWIIILGITVTIILAVSSFFISDYTRYKETCKADLTATNEKMEVGMKIRIRLEERMKNIEDDVTKLQDIVMRKK